MKSRLACILLLVAISANLVVAGPILRRMIGPCDEDNAHSNSGTLAARLRPCNYTTADFVVGGFVYVQGVWNDEEEGCELLPGSASFQIPESARWGVELAQAELGKTLTVVYDFKATCNRMAEGVIKEQTLEYVHRLAGLATGTCEDQSAARSEATAAPSGDEVLRRTHPPVSAMLGPPSSKLSISAARLVSLFSLPMVSYSATAVELSNKCYYPHFLRMVPPDSEQASIIAEFAKQQRWKSILLIHSRDLYAERLASDFRKEADERDLCIVGTVVLSAVADLETVTAIAALLERGQEYRNVSSTATVVLIAAQRSTAALYFNAVLGRPELTTNKTTFLAPDSWAFAADLIPDALLNDLCGMIGFAPHVRHGTRITEHMLSVNPASRPNPFVRPVWEVMFNCSFEEDIAGGQTECVDSQLILDVTLALNGKVAPAFDAAQAIAYAINATVAQECADANGQECSQADLRRTVRKLRHRRLDGSNLLAQLVAQPVRSLLDGVETRFDPSTGDPTQVPYTIGNLQLFPGDDVGNGSRALVPQYVEVGSAHAVHSHKGETEFNCHDDAVLEVEMLDVHVNITSAIIWNNGSTIPPQSICSHPCHPRYRIRHVLDAQGRPSKCCFVCLPCTGQRYSRAGDQACRECEPETYANAEHTACVPIEVDYIGKRGITYGVLVLCACVTVCAIVYTLLLVFNTSLKWSIEKPLIAMTSTGVAFSQLVFVPWLMEPTDTICSILSIGPAALFSVAMAPMVVIATHQSRLPRKLMRGNTVATSIDNSSEQQQQSVSGSTGGPKHSVLQDEDTVRVSGLWLPKRPSGTAFLAPEHASHSALESGFSGDVVAISLPDLRHASEAVATLTQKHSGGSGTLHSLKSAAKSHMSAKKSPLLTDRTRRRLHRGRRKAKRVLGTLKSCVVCSVLLCLSVIAILASSHVIAPVRRHTAVEPHISVSLVCGVHNTSIRIGYASYLAFALWIIALDAHTVYLDRTKRRRCSARTRLASLRRDHLRLYALRRHLLHGERHRAVDDLVPARLLPLLTLHLGHVPAAAVPWRHEIGRAPWQHCGRCAFHCQCQRAAQPQGRRALSPRRPLPTGGGGQNGRSGAGNQREYIYKHALERTYSYAMQWIYRRGILQCERDRSHGNLIFPI